LFQSALIVLIGSALFGVSWGDPVAAATLIVVWALVGAGAGMLSGTLFRTADQAGAIGSAIGIGLAMLGGCMWPLALVAPAMRAIGHLSPHAWAVDAWTALLSRNGGLGDIALQVLVLSAVAAGLLSLAAVRMRRRLLD
jgi:ABC-2 type transport system permease protein